MIALLTWLVALMPLLISDGGAGSKSVKAPTVELFVCDGESQVIKAYDGKTGAYLRDFAVGNGLRGGHAGVFGPDGNLYVSIENNAVQRFDGQTGQFLDTFASGHGLNNCTALAFGPDGNLYVGNAWSNQITRFDAHTGAYVDEFLKGERGGLDVVGSMAFGADGNLYVISGNHIRGRRPDLIKRYQAVTGAFMGDFAGGNGLDIPVSLVFGPDGDLYVLNAVGETAEVRRFHGRTGAFRDVFIAKRSGELKPSNAFTFGPDGDLYILELRPGVVKHFDGKTGKYKGDLIPPGSGGLQTGNFLTFRPAFERHKTR